MEKNSSDVGAKISNFKIFKIDSYITYQICKNTIIQINKNNNTLFLINNQDLVGILLNKDMENDLPYYPL